ncbi:hypothetical protein BJ138DRAFT_1155070 [Hygrophoropsis aurantiaca]|uniref:Uncharacterized protein n=1 Tax=Hygrophoropsis aurantiaca TaxID=72124 RepID=A0ACB8A9W5_9AGAM|nr:hypothetical protein BJ138DRAFT_1155070 [Hygrophoropsis aurantiaca]
MYTTTNTRCVLSLWMILALTALVAASPAPAPVPAPIADPEPAPIDPALAALITSNLNLGCVHGCPAADSAREAQANAALSTSQPLTLLGAMVLTGGMLAAL